MEEEREAGRDEGDRWDRDSTGWHKSNYILTQEYCG